MDPDGTFIWDPDFPNLLNSRCCHKVYENMDLESQDPRFNANLGLDENSIWTKKLRCSHPKRPSACVACRCSHSIRCSKDKLEDMDISLPLSASLSGPTFQS